MEQFSLRVSKNQLGLAQGEHLRFNFFIFQTAA